MAVGTPQPSASHMSSSTDLGQRVVKLPAIDEVSKAALFEHALKRSVPSQKAQRMGKKGKIGQCQCTQRPPGSRCSRPQATDGWHPLPRSHRAHNSHADFELMHFVSIRAFRFKIVLGPVAGDLPAGSLIQTKAW